MFLDPDPDPARSFAERRRLFGLPRSSWADYDPSLISEGGGVYPRTLKSIPVSEPVRRALGLGDGVTSLDPTALISAALAAPVDLLWNGGIGTYVKAETETNAEVGDKANDGLRVNGAQLRARCVGEGGNLGLTQLGRIEYATCGGKINTDFIDNSAGVDTSDHEVNIKVLLAPDVAAGRLTTEARDALLASMTDDVAGLVLAHNVSQNLALANAEAQAPSMARVHGEWIDPAGGAGADRPGDRVPARGRGPGGPPRQEPGAHLARARRPAGVHQDRAERRGRAQRPARRAGPGRPARRTTSRRRCGARTTSRCGSTACTARS